MNASAKPCPICGEPSDVLFKPFCSKRCTHIDLHRWFGETYRVETAEGPDDPSRVPDDED
ncbi:MAG TPA: DNA gyrase inhibitor YacG [Aliidongia sp.]|uniref:DNA gyrase inhibitor YacG n=1 Tax=Aliidongia sp. TaxID=1914230 RepID=UPI002DDDBBED|nr:DNA gyrase inhibitor YacG [Aliidongia sp.]HEV2677653.1 DNA gyrase inhibitor YacG [Aliidongia sp.]